MTYITEGKINYNKVWERRTRSKGEAFQSKEEGGNGTASENKEALELEGVAFACFLHNISQSQ